MKKILAFMLSLTLCLSMAACAESAEPVKETTGAPAVSATETLPEETIQETEAVEETVPQATYSEQVEANYRAIMNGEVSGQGAEIIKAQDEDTAKLLLDFLTNIFNDDVLGGLQACSGRELDQIMSEAFYVVNSIREQDEETDQEPESEQIDSMGYTMVLYSEDLGRSIRIRLNEEYAFMEPDWAMMTDQPENYFIHAQGNYEIFTLYYSEQPEETTEELIKGWLKQDAAKGRETSATAIETFTAGGIEWEIFALVFDQTSTGIDKDTGKEISLTSTVYDTTCFARLDDGGFLQIDTGISVNPDIIAYYKNVLCTSIKEILVDQGVG